MDRLVSFAVERRFLMVGLFAAVVIVGPLLSLLLWSLSGLVGGWLHARLARAG